MSVEEQLRSYLAEQARTVPPIDTHLFERALLRHRARRRQMTAMGVATVSAVAILVVAALALPVTWGDDTPVQQTTGPIDTAPPSDLVWTYLSSMEGAEDAYTYDSLALAARAATSVVLGRFTSFEPGTGAAPVDGVLVVG